MSELEDNPKNEDDHKIKMTPNKDHPKNEDNPNIKMTPKMKRNRKIKIKIIFFVCDANL